MPLDTIEQFTISRLQVLDEEGNLDHELMPDLDEDGLHRLYRSMVLAREADQKMLKLQRQGRLGTFPPCTGHEAVSCGAAFAMQERDWLVPTYRELGARLLRGEPLENSLLYYNGYEEGSRDSMKLRTFPTQVILGSQLPHAVGLAYAMQYQGEDDVAVVAFVGDGGASQGDFHEALNVAGTWNVPVVFIVQNNGWAISVPRSMQTRSSTFAQKAIAYGFPGLQVDGNDVFAVYRATMEALERARAGGGPTLIEAVTYRLMMHTTADDPTKYRDKEEEERWWRRDPIPRLRKHLEQQGAWDEARQVELEASIKEQVDTAVRRFEEKSDYDPAAPFDHVFGTRIPEIEAQREEFLAALKQENSDA